MTRTTYESNCNISLTLLTLLMLGVRHSPRQNTCAMVCLRGSCNSVGVASILFRRFVSFLELLTSHSLCAECNEI